MRYAPHFLGWKIAIRNLVSDTELPDIEWTMHGVERPDQRSCGLKCKSIRHGIFVTYGTNKPYDNWRSCLPLNRTTNPNIGEHEWRTVGVRIRISQPRIAQEQLHPQERSAHHIKIKLSPL
jgi:hypothetical protein